MRSLIEDFRNMPRRQRANLMSIVALLVCFLGLSVRVVVMTFRDQEWSAFPLVLLVIVICGWISAKWIRDYRRDYPRQRSEQ